MLQGRGGDRVWSGCFTGILSPQEPADIPLLHGDRCRRRVGGLRGRQLWKGGGGGVGELGLMDGVMGDGVRNALYFKSAVEII